MNVPGPVLFCAGPYEVREIVPTDFLKRKNFAVFRGRIMFERTASQKLACEFAADLAIQLIQETA